jgi:hypothetical protein
MKEASPGWSEGGEEDTAESPTSLNRAIFVFLTQNPQQQTKAPREKAETLIKLESGKHCLELSQVYKAKKGYHYQGRNAGQKGTKGKF